MSMQFSALGQVIAQATEAVRDLNTGGGCPNFLPGEPHVVRRPSAGAVHSDQYKKYNNNGNFSNDSNNNASKKYLNVWFLFKMYFSVHKCILN